VSRPRRGTPIGSAPSQRWLRLRIRTRSLTARCASACPIARNEPWRLGHPRHNSVAQLVQVGFRFIDGEVDHNRVHSCPSSVRAWSFDCNRSRISSMAAPVRRSRTRR
jgi:hypothetical protein